MSTATNTNPTTTDSSNATNGATDETNNSNEQILTDIQTLQQMEQQLFSHLESDPSLTQEQQQQLIDKMNQLSSMRINLYQTLGSLNVSLEQTMNASMDYVKEQSSAVQIVEQELNRSKQRLQALEDEKNNKIRLVEINSYFGDRYAEHAQMMKILICILIPVILATFLYNKGWLPLAVYYGLLVLITAVGGYFFWMRYMSIAMRDNMNYQQYDWSFNPNAAATTSTSTTTSSDPWISNTNMNIGVGTCIGNGCCSSGLTYDASTNVCVISSSEGFVSTPFAQSFSQREKVRPREEEERESLVNRVLTKTQPNKYNTDYDLRDKKPYNG